MFIWSVTLTKEKIALLLAVLLIFLLILGVCVSYFRQDSLRTNRGRINLLTSCGLSPDSSPLSVQSFKIPKEFDSFWNEYESLQQSQGLSLLPYRNKTIKKYTYPVSLENKQTVYANLFLHGSKLVACDLCNPHLTEGWIKPLFPQENTGEERTDL